MIPDIYTKEKFALAHSQQLQREAEHERLLAQLPEPNRSVLLLLLAQLALSLRTLRMRLRKGLQRRIA
jgi:hypothetical protein